jgi:hypothetical protein
VYLRCTILIVLKTGFGEEHRRVRILRKTRAWERKQEVKNNEWGAKMSPKKIQPTFLILAWWVVHISNLTKQRLHLPGIPQALNINESSILVWHHRDWWWLWQTREQMALWRRGLPFNSSQIYGFFMRIRKCSFYPHAEDIFHWDYLSPYQNQSGSKTLT